MTNRNSTQCSGQVPKPVLGEDFDCIFHDILSINLRKAKENTKLHSMRVQVSSERLVDIANKYSIL